MLSVKEGVPLVLFGLTLSLPVTPMGPVDLKVSVANGSLSFGGEDAHATDGLVWVGNGSAVLSVAAGVDSNQNAAAELSVRGPLDAVNAALEACRASRAVVAAKLAKREEKKELRRKRDQREGDAKAARCQCPSTCVLGGVQFTLRRRIMVPSCRRP